MKAVVPLLVLLGGSEASWPPVPPSTDPTDAGIQRAIADFSRTRRFVRRDSVFDVSVDEPARHVVPVHVDERTVRLAPGPPVEGLVAICIVATRATFLVTADAPARLQRKLPTRYVEKDGRLYYWRDPRAPLTDETLAVFKKHRLLQDDEGGRVTFPANAIDDAKKGVTYYFCRQNPARYKRVFTSRAAGYYEPPAVHCP